jgi:hypothetical protein
MQESDRVIYPWSHMVWVLLNDGVCYGVLGEPECLFIIAETLSVFFWFIKEISVFETWYLFWARSFALVSRGNRRGYCGDFALKAE